MANPPKAKGTAFETATVNRLRHVWPNADRAKTGNESHDIVGCGPWVIECKHRRRWNVFDWVGRIRRVADGRPWAIIAAHGDRRSVTGRQVGTVVIVDLEDWLALNHQLADQQ